MGVIQAKCCEAEDKREADRKADAEEKALVTVACQDDAGDINARAEICTPISVNMEGCEGQNKTSDADQLKTNELDNTGETDVQPIAADTSAAEVEATPQDEASTAPEGCDVVEQSLEKTEARLAHDGDEDTTKDAADQKVQVEVDEAKQELDVQKQTDYSSKSSAKKAAAKKKVAASKARGKAKAKAKSDDDSKQVSEANPAKKMPMNAKEREAAWEALTKEQQTAEADKLVKAIEAGHLDTIGRLMKEGVKPDTRNESGETALFVAAKNGDVSLLDFLISNCGADINVTTKHKESAMHAACRYDKKDAMEWLVTHGINRNIKNKKGETAADVARGETAKSEILTFKMPRQK